MTANEAFLDEHPSGFNRKGSQIDYYFRAKTSIMSSGGLINRQHSPSLNELSETSPARNRTEATASRRQLTNDITESRR